MQSKIHFSNVEFQYENMSYPLFQELSFEWDLIWKLALVGKNGCGKSTLVRLIERRLIPGSGKIQQPGSVSFLPVYKDIDSQKGLVSEVVEQVVAPFSKWVHELEHFSQCEDLDGIQSCLDLLESHGWHDFETRMEQVFSQMQLDHSLLRREFSSLSGGEKTRVMLAALFLKPNSYVILDEPTHHLDEWARGAVARFLQRQKGFLLISHDRYFLNQCVDHVAHLQNGSVELYRSGFEEFEDALWKHKVFIENSNEKLRKEIRRLDIVYQAKKGWSLQREKDKIGAYDKGFVGARAAKMMKRAIHARQMAQDRMEEKKDLVEQLEDSYSLTCQSSRSSSFSGTKTLLNVHSLRFGIKESAQLCNHLDFVIKNTDRVAIRGYNGCGKSSLIHLLIKTLATQPISMSKLQEHSSLSQYSGSAGWYPGLSTSYSSQDPYWEEKIEDVCRKWDLSYTQLCNTVGSLGVDPKVLNHPCSELSEGQKKKISLALSLIAPVDLRIWDEPLNFIDMACRQQLEEMILREEPTLLFIEHDRRFMEEVATHEIRYEEGRWNFRELLNSNSVLAGFST